MTILLSLPLWLISIIYRLYYIVVSMLIYPITVLFKLIKFEFDVPDWFEKVDDWFMNLSKR